MDVSFFMMGAAMRQFKLLVRVASSRSSLRWEIRKSRKQKAESRKQKAESRKQKAERGASPERADGGFLMSDGGWSRPAATSISRYATPFPGVVFLCQAAQNFWFPT